MSDNINTGFPGVVYNFNAADQTCEVQLAMESLFMGLENSWELQDSERLINVPVQFIQGGGWSLTHPVPDGSPCYVHFAQRGTDHYYESGATKIGLNRYGSPNPQFSRKFDINSAVCVIGIQPSPKAIPGFQPSSFELRNSDRGQRITLLPSSDIEIISGSTKIVLKANDSVTITADSKTTVKSPQIMLDGATTVTKSLTVLGGMSVQGGEGGSTMSITGDIKQTGSFSLNGIKVDGHIHKANGEYADTDKMK